MERVVNLGHCRLDDWHESVRRAAVVAVAKIAAGGSQKTNRAEQRQRQQRHAMACWKGVSFWVPFCAWFFSCHLQILEWSWILNSCDYLCVCVVQCCSPVNFANFMMTQEKGDQHSIELEKTACDDRRISLFFFFVSLVRCVASTAGQQLLRHVGQWMGWHVQVVDCAEGADWVGGGKKYSFYIWFLAYRHKVFRS